MNYEETNNVIKKAEKLKEKHQKAMVLCESLEDKIAMQRVIKEDANYIFWLKSNFYAIADGEIKLTDYKPTTKN